MWKTPHLLLTLLTSKQRRTTFWWVARANRRDWSTCAIGAFTPDLGQDRAANCGGAMAIVLGLAQGMASAPRDVMLEMHSHMHCLVTITMRASVWNSQQAAQVAMTTSDAKLLEDSRSIQKFLVGAKRDVRLGWKVWGSATETFCHLIREIRCPPLCTLLHWKINPKVLSVGDAGFLKKLGLFRVIMANLNQNHKWIDILLTHPSMHVFFLSHQGKHKTIDPTCKGRTHWVI